jgi:hypothetical protein
MTFLIPVFIAATVFGCGILIIDLFGVLTHFDSSHNDSSHDVSDHNGISDQHGVMEEHHVVETDHNNHNDSKYDNSTSKVFHDIRQKSNPVIIFLNILRDIVYFCVGFGPAGLFMLFMKKGVVESLIWSLISGFAIMGMTIVVKKLIPKDTIDSQLTDEDYIMAKGEVIVSINKGKMGKVRLFYDGYYADRYAVLKNGSKSLSTGEKIRVIEVREDALVVEEESNIQENLI